MRDPDAAYAARRSATLFELFDKDHSSLGCISLGELKKYNYPDIETYYEEKAAAKKKSDRQQTSDEWNQTVAEKAQMRTFDTGATRNLDENKLDYEGFLSPLVLERYAQYMHKHRKQADGVLRESDNWQKGMPIKEYMKSLWRHVMDVWRQLRGLPGEDEIEDSLCATIFNSSGMLHELLKLRKKLVPQSDLKRRYPELFLDPKQMEDLARGANQP